MTPYYKKKPPVEKASLNSAGGTGWGITIFFPQPFSSFFIPFVPHSPLLPDSDLFQFQTVIQMA